MKAANKYIYVWVVQGYYPPYCWEDLTQSESRKEARNDLKAYLQNEPGAFRLIQRRELNPQAA